MWEMYEMAINKYQGTGEQGPGDIVVAAESTGSSIVWVLVDIVDTVDYSRP